MSSSQTIATDTGCTQQAPIILTTTPPKKNSLNLVTCTIKGDSSARQELSHRHSETGTFSDKLNSAVAARPENEFSIKVIKIFYGPKAKI
jgi:hypothetical protein